MKKIDILKNQLARSLADYDNLRKRTEEEKSIWIKFATQKFIQNLLPVLDTLEKAQKHLNDAGLAIAITQFKDAIKNEGLEEITPSSGDEFNENLHEAIEVIPDTQKDNKIAEVVLSGWKFKDMPTGNQEKAILRPAKVKVFKKETPLDK
jgi:molecular chaperone GrpE